MPPAAARGRAVGEVDRQPRRLGRGVEGRQRIADARRARCSRRGARESPRVRCATRSSSASLGDRVERPAPRARRSATRDHGERSIVLTKRWTSRSGSGAAFGRSYRGCFCPSHDTSVDFLPVSEHRCGDTPERRRRWRLRAPRLRSRPPGCARARDGRCSWSPASPRRPPRSPGSSAAASSPRIATLQRAISRLCPPPSGASASDSFDLPIGKSYAAHRPQGARRTRAAAPREPVPADVVSARSRSTDELVRLAGIDDLPRGRCASCPDAGRGSAARHAARWCRSAPAAAPRLDEGGHPSRPGRGRRGPGRKSSAARWHDLAGRHRAAAAASLGAPRRSSSTCPRFRGIFQELPLDLAARPVKPADLADGERARPRVGGAGAARRGRATPIALTGPDAALLERARQDGQVASKRMVLVGGEISALLLGFALVAAIGLRRGIWNEARRLTQRGARRTQVWLAVAAEVGSMTLAGVSAGLVARSGRRDSRSRAPPGCRAGPLLRHSLVTWLGLAIVGGVWVGRDLRDRRRGQRPRGPAPRARPAARRRRRDRRRRRGRDRPQQRRRRAPERSSRQPAPLHPAARRSSASSPRSPPDGCSVRRCVSASG